MDILYKNLLDMDFRYIIMWIIGGVLIYLAIKKDMEPTLLLPIGFGTILVNLPNSGAITQVLSNGSAEEGALSTLFDMGIANELFPLILFIGIGAMIDFGPLLSNPKLMIFGAAAQFGIFFTLCLASIFFDQSDAASIAIIGAADGPTAIVVANKLKSQFLAPIMVAAYSYMALVPIIQPPVIRLLTTKEERKIRMEYSGKEVSKLTKILFPIIITIVAGLIAPASVSLIGFLMFGNLLNVSGVTDRLSKTAQNELMNTVTIFLGVSVGATANASNFLAWSTIKIIVLGLCAFCISTIGGLLFGKLMYVVTKGKINPLIGSAGVSAVPMAARVSQVVGQKENPSNFLLMHAMGPNVAGVIGSAVAAGVFLSYFG